jgi:hypothetical protein
MADAPKDKAKEPVSGEKGFDPTKQPGYQEYPKWVNGTLCASKEDEDALAAGSEPEPKPKAK